ncbi:MAG: glutathione S-transferase family protein [Alphaproteobacteria bacterium]|nr:glutathione S-transferase family protein [Alphaproteobacteria bacterium]
MTTIQLFGFAGSTYVRSAMISCEELGLNWELAPLEFGKASHLALHPFGKMPVLQHGSVCLYETAAILSYLNDLRDPAVLVPADPIDKARMWQIVSICNDYAYPALVKASFADDASTIDTEPAGRCLDALSTLIGQGTYLAGDRFSLADIVFEPMLTQYLGSVPAAGKQLEDRPHIAQWHRGMLQRPAIVSAYKEIQSA